MGRCACCQAEVLADVVEADVDAEFHDAKTETQMGVVDTEAGLVDVKTDANAVLNVFEDDCFTKKEEGFFWLITATLEQSNLNFDQWWKIKNI